MNNKPYIKDRILVREKDTLRDTFVIHFIDLNKSLYSKDLEVKYPHPSIYLSII